jgi:hypothetical protein
VFLPAAETWVPRSREYDSLDGVDRISSTLYYDRNDQALCASRRSRRVPRARQAAREAAIRRTGGAPLVCTVIERARAFAAVDASGSAAVHFCGAEGDLPILVYVAARDAGYVALRNRVDLDRVVARLRCSALALVNGITTSTGPNALADRFPGGDTPHASNLRQGGQACPT